MVWSVEVRSRGLWVVVTFQYRVDGGISMLRVALVLRDFSVDPVARVSSMTKRLLPWCDQSVQVYAGVAVGVFASINQAPSDVH